MEYLKEHNTPIDFFSWHTYGLPDIVLVESDFVSKTLKEYGFGHIENHLNEWNLSHDRKINKGTSFASANVMNLMLSMQHKNTDMLMYYDARYVNISAYGGFFDVVTYEPSCVYYSFKAFGELYSLQNEVECTSEIPALAATDGEKKCIILSNVCKDCEIELNVTDDFCVYIIDKDNFIAKTDLNPNAFTLKENTVAVIKNY